MLSSKTLKKSVAVFISVAMMLTMLAGLTMTSVSAADGETIYNMSALEPLPDKNTMKNGTTIFGGAVGYKIVDNGEKLDADPIVSTISPGGTRMDFTSILRTKGPELTVDVKANQTMVVYYKCCDSKAVPKAADIAIRDASGKAVASETNDEKGGEQYYTISCKAKADGKLTFYDASAKISNRTDVYAIVVTPYEFHDSGSAEPAPPAEIGAFTAEPGDGMVTLSWDPVPGAEFYNVYVNGDEVESGTINTSYVAAGLQNGTQYTFKLEAVNTAGKTDKTITAAPAAPTVKPESFTLSGSARDKEVGLYWTAARYAKTYNVMRGTETIAAGLPAETLSYRDIDLTNGTEYTYKVVAVNDNGTTDSNEIKVTPVEPPPSEIKIPEDHPAVGWLESANVIWTNSAEVDGYNVYLVSKDGAETKLDNELIRYYGGYYRADAIGVKPGEYYFKIENAGDQDDFVLSNTFTVQKHVREGFAFDPASSEYGAYDAEGIGAYKNDGTLKDGAQVIYVDDKNKDTVTLTVNVGGKDTVGVGLGNILALREKDKAEPTPLAIRLIGQIEKPAGIDDMCYINVKKCRNITIEGVGDDAVAYHWSLLLREAKNVEVRNLAVMEFYDDGISLDTKNYNCWVHNCDIFYGQYRGGDQKKGDGSLDVKTGSDYCTFSYNHFWDSGKSSLCGMKSDSFQGYHMTYHHNWFDHSDSRHPRIRGDQVHIYNNYYDGNSKYGVGVCTGGSAFVEKNVFRNVKFPMLIALQGSDIHGENQTTFSGETGGMIKAFDNDIRRGSQSQTFFTQNEPDGDSNNVDAYVVNSRDEIVPETFTAVADGSKYSNFDTADNMYDYVPDDVNQVVALVEAYAGRVCGGDFKYEFNDETDDASYDRSPVLGDKLASYKTTLGYSYTSPASYPATDGSAVGPGPTAPTIPTPGPTLKPGEKPTPAPTPTPTKAPVMAGPVMWDFGKAPFTVTEEGNVHPDTNYFTAGKASSSGAMQYNIKSDSITPEVFGGLKLTTSGALENKYQKSDANFSDGFKGTWQIKTKTAFSFIPALRGTVTIYARHGSTTASNPVDTVTVKQGGKNMGTHDYKPGKFETYEPFTVDVAAGEKVEISGSEETGYYGILYKANGYNIESVEQNGDSLDVTVTYGESDTPPAGVMLAAKCDAAGALKDFAEGGAVSGPGKYTVNGFKLDEGETLKLFIWNNLTDMVPLAAPFEKNN